MTQDPFGGRRSSFMPELVPRHCRLKRYTPIAVQDFQLADDIIAYVSPESTYAVTKQLLDAATKSILIGIYDFTASYIKDSLVAAVRRGVQVSVMLDLDGRKGEPELWNALLEQGIQGVPAPSCASTHARYFSSSHEKVIVIDDIWTLIQSGNYSENSIPKNERDGGDGDRFVHGNRDMGVAIKSTPLAAFFTRILRSDMQLELNGTAPETSPAEHAVIPNVLLEAGQPQEPPPRLFPSQHFNPRSAVHATPVLSPDNYMQVVPDFLASATQSIFIEQQYIRGTQPEIRKLLAAIRSAMDRHPDLQVRIILAIPYFSGMVRERESLEAIAEFGLHVGTHIRFLNPRYFVHCHNKLIIVDRQMVLIGSQNWSATAVTKNREASLLLRYPPLARHFSTIFGLDWRTGLQTLSETTMPGAAIDPELAPPGRRVNVRLGDYLEV